jgi:hypothetical protein
MCHPRHYLLDLLAMAAGIDLGKATIDKFNEVSNRIDCPVKIRLDGSDWCITRAD